MSRAADATPLWRKRAVWILQVASDHEQQPAALHVAVAIAAHIHETSLSAWPSQQTLARMTGLSIKHVGDQITALKISGHLTTKSRGPKTPIITIIIDGAEDQNHSAEHSAGEDTNCSSEHLAEDSHSGSEQDQNHSAEHFPERPHLWLQMTPPPGGTEPMKEPRARAHARENLPKVVVSPPVLPSIEKVRETGPDEFNEWYRAYPRHVARQEAAKAYLAARKGGASAEQLLDGARRYANERAEDRRADAQKFTAHPATWLRAGRWLDEPAGVAAPTHLRRDGRPSALDFARLDEDLP